MDREVPSSSSNIDVSSDNNNDASVKNFESNSNVQHTTPDIEIESMSLEESICDCSKIVEIFLNNRFDEAIELCEKWKNRSIYHSFTKATLKAMVATVTLEAPALDEGKQTVSETLEFLGAQRKQSSLSENISSLFWKVNFDDYSDEEIHTEALMAFLMLASGTLTILSEQTFLAFVKAGLRIRSGVQLYKFCEDALTNRKQWDSEFSRHEFQCAAQFGVGTFNLLISHMPAKVLKLVAFLGFPCDREKGLKLLDDVIVMKDTFTRNFTAYLCKCFYFLYLEPIFGMTEGAFSRVEPIVNEMLKKHPNGCIPLLLKARMEELKGNPDTALECFRASVDSQNKWIQLTNICYWDMIWCHAIRCEWGEAAEYARLLVEQCKWSPSTNCYQVAVFTHLLGTESNTDTENEVMKLMEKVNGLRLRFAGKSLPPEKFAATKAEKFILEKGNIPLPAIELFHVWSIFSITAGQPKYLENILNIIEKDLQKFKVTVNNNNDFIVPMDNYALCLLLKAVCLRHLKRLDESIHCLQEIINNGNRIITDTYILPNAYCEIGLSYIKLEKYSEAEEFLETSKNNFTGYLMETMVHLRAHNGLLFIKQAKKAAKPQKKSLRRALTFF